MLQKITLHSITNRECQETLSQHNAGYDIDDGHLCTLNDFGIGLCSGDSGGPLVVNNRGSLQVIGVVSSFFQGCGALFSLIYLS